MALLKKLGRDTARSRFTEQINSLNEPIAVTRPVLIATVSAVDKYLNDNLSMIDAALPLEARLGLTDTQKARIIMNVAMMRYDDMLDPVSKVTDRT